MIRYFDTGILVDQHVTIPKATLNNLQLTTSKDAFLPDTSRISAADLHLWQRNVWCKWLGGQDYCKSSTYLFFLYSGYLLAFTHS